MKLTKYEHACFTLEENDQILVVDPGNFSSDFIPTEAIVAVVITHKHADHFEPELIAQIFAKNDDVLVLGPADVISQVKVENKQVVDSGDKVTVGPFNLEFFGGLHALIHESMPRVQNLGVMINDLVYYPGDSFVAPGRMVDSLAIPAAAPWMKIGEAMDFLREIHPRFAFPTHDAIYSEAGKSMVDKMLSSVAQDVDTLYQRLDAPLDI